MKNNTNDCISLVNEQDVCYIIKVLKALIIACDATLILLIIFRKQILNSVLTKELIT